VREVWTPLDRVDMLSLEQALDREAVEAIERVGHSRLPVFRGPP